MAHFGDQEVLPVTAASAIGAYLPVRGLEGASSVDERVIAAASLNEFAVGLTIATVATAGDPAQVAFGGRAKAIAGASLGAFAPVAVGSTNGILVPVARGAVASAVKNQVGIALQSAVAGDVFTVLVKPAQVV